MSILHILNNRVELANKIDGIIKEYCENHRCCEEDDKSIIVNSILEEFDKFNSKTINPEIERKN